MPSPTGTSASAPSLPDDDRLRAMLSGVPLPPLIAALAQATGDLTLLRDDLRPDAAHLHEPQGGLSSEQRAAGRQAVIDALKRLGAASAPATDHAALLRMTTFVLGQSVSDDYLPLLLEELAVSGEDLRAPSWHKDAIAPRRDFVVAIVGAGMSGLVAAHRLRQAGVPFVILEKNDDVGGTWFENSYPGCRVDVPNHLYSYSFVQRHDWPQRFTTQPVLLDYFRGCADELALRGHLRCNTEVLEATFDVEGGRWVLKLRTPDGDETLEANVVVSAVGQLNRPSVPAIAGAEKFAGPAFHSAEWDHDVGLAGKRVAVIGTGASGIQLIPIVAAQAAEVFVFQRTPNWFMPTPDYHDGMPDGMQWLLRHVPFFSEWYRFWLFWRLAEGALAAARVDPSWTGDDRSVSALNDDLRALLSQYLEAEFADAPELAGHVVPNYPPLAKRMLLDNGTWARTLKRDNVHLVTEPITEITPTGIVTSDGSAHDVDVIVYATGFHASKFLTPMRVVGRGGVDLHELWGDDAHAYLGMTVPGFPNLFCLYGPNTNLVANGSIIFFSECAARYVVESVRLLLERELDAMDCRRDVYDDYATLVDEGNRKMAWGVSTVNSWYKNAEGRVTQNWPFTLLEFWQRTCAPDPADYDLG
ncbi:MAG: flavin-containing monooxygenase [Acidimicrobiales bacterium]